jgi:diguanylate cyclase (GGDEF)-like protein/PAS domain S-box-containing protein
VIQDTRTAFSLIRKLWFTVVGMGTTAAIFIIMISLAASRKMAGPILQIAKIASQGAQGDFDRTAPCTVREDEIGALAADFNRMMENLKNQRARLADKGYADAVIADMSNSLIVLNHQMIIKTVNKAALNLLGYSQEEIVGQSIKLIFAEKLPFDESWLERMIQSGSIRNVETTYRSKDGRTIPVIFSCSMMKDDRSETDGIICVAQDLTERKMAETALAEQAIRDSLTNLYNRRYFNSRMEEEITRASRDNHILAILLCDIDHFKTINDTRGHQVGDEVLRTMAKGMQKTTRGTDLVFRWGGDEFVVVLSNSTREGILVSAERIRKEIHSISQAAKLSLDISIGVALFPEHGRSVDELVRLADRALYIAKKGGDKIHIGEEEYRLNENTIKVVFQPIQDVKSDRIIGYEALSRDAQGKLTILELFKRYQAIGQLDELKCLCFKLQLKAAQETGLSKVFINADFTVLDQLEFIPKPPGLEIILEISEAEALRDVENHLKRARKWRDGGYQFAIDDFGAGFVSLPFIATLVPDYIKMDRSTILQAVTSETFRKFSKDLVRALKNYAKEGIIAEGIETEKELNVVKEMGMHIVQGFLFGKPQELKQPRQV